MKLALTTSLLVASVGAFSPSFAPVRTNTAINAEQMSRSAFLQTSLTAAAATFVTLASPQEASAAKYGSVGRDSSAVLDPKDAIIDDEILATEAVQKSISNLKAYLNIVQKLKANVASNGQADIVPMIRTDLDFVALRGAMNTLTTAFDEDTQRGTDRLVRIIIQDISELEANSKLKEGIPRSEKRLVVINGKLDKLEKAFSDLLAFV
mmetsp:Transcript_6881/g.10141  ORF Transcript_6881/g.10141 Transcript_6881/m.10141 type:complete len:208 (+) Transcript_6881:117-740(+)